MKGDETWAIKIGDGLKLTAESMRLAEDARETAFGQKIRKWKRWGPYLSERQWGTVREDYSAHGTAWDYFPHDLARSRAYRWGEDGLAGFCDHIQRLCLSIALWNEQDPILKERLFGLTNSEGNHGEDVKEQYYYLDATPSHAYLKMLYKYPQRAFPYADLVEENRRRTMEDPEYELLDTGVFDDDRYFDVFVEYAQAEVNDVLGQVTVVNRGPEPAPIHVLPHLWFRNTWSWGTDEDRADDKKPNLAIIGDAVRTHHERLGAYHFYFRGEDTKADDVWFCDNETNPRRLFGMEDAPGYFKDAFHERLIDGRVDAVNPQQTGTKCAPHFRFVVPAGGQVRVQFRLKHGERLAHDEAFAVFDQIIGQRRNEADAFYAELQHDITDADEKNVQRQALAGMIWSKQFYCYDMVRWLNGDPGQPPPPESRRHGRNSEWVHLYNANIISMPDKWEYPWYAAWDLAFHCIPLALIDPDFAKQQLVLMTREWYMHPNGQLPAYEWAFEDVNPPVHAWAAWRVYKLDKKAHGGKGDKVFLERVFHKLMLNFTWWVNRKDAEGRNIFQGGFLGLDNIGAFDRSAPLPTGGFISQADGTSWMAMYSLNLMRIALELAVEQPVYGDIASKFFEHFLLIAEAMTNIAGEGIGLWDSEDEFYYDVLNLPGNHRVPLKVRSMVGLIPLFAVETLSQETLEKVPGFHRRLLWVMENRPHLAKLVSRWNEPGKGDRRLLSLLRGHRMKCLLRRMLDETEFLSDYGIRAMSRYHKEHPYVFHSDDVAVSVGYQPSESRSGLFGGNSNWRGPIWFPVNFLLIESLQKFHHYYGDDFKIECPTGSGRFLTIAGVANELSNRLIRLFLKDETGQRPVLKYNQKLANDPHFKDYVLFHEYFHGDNGRGVGASHQTGWTGLVAKLLMPRRS